MTRRAYLLLIIMTTSYVCLLYSGERLFLWILLMSIAVFAFARLNIWYTLRNMRLRQGVEPKEINSGDIADYVITIVNPRFLPLAHMDIRFDNMDTLLNSGFSFESIQRMSSRSLIPSVMPGKIKTIRRTMHFPYRGQYTPSILSGELYDIFGLFKRSLPSSLFTVNRQAVTILPQPALTTLDPIKDSPSSEGASGEFGERDPYLIADIRQYQLGDSLKQIHWKLTARIGSLQVKEYDVTHSMRLAIFIDLSHHGFSNEPAAMLEDRICQYATAVCREALASHTPFRLVTYGENGRWELTDDESRSLLYFQHFLAGLRFRSPYLFHEIIRMEMLAQSAASHIIVISSNPYPALTRYLSSLSVQSYGVSLLIVPTDGVEDVGRTDDDATQDTAQDTAEHNAGSSAEPHAPNSAEPHAHNSVEPHAHNSVEEEIQNREEADTYAT